MPRTRESYLIRRVPPARNNGQAAVLFTDAAPPAVAVPVLRGERQHTGGQAHRTAFDRAQSMLEEAHDTAARLGAGGVTREIAECRAALAATGT